MIHLRITQDGEPRPEDETACGVEVCRLGRFGRATLVQAEVTCEECRERVPATADLFDPEGEACEECDVKGWAIFNDDSARGAKR